MLRQITFGIILLFSACAPANAQRPPTPPEIIKYQPGDIVLFVSPNYLQRFINGAVTGGEVTHTGLVIMGKNGTLQILHALGNDNGLSHKFNPGAEFGVIIEPLEVALKKEQDVYGQRLIFRPRKEPLSAEMSKALTEFAYRQKGKPYSSPKIAGPLIAHPFKNRPLITEPDSYMCSELACTALVAIGALPATVNPPAITPFDFYNPQRLTMPLWQPKLDPNGKVMYWEKYMIPDLDRYGNEQRDWLTGRIKMKQGTINPVEKGWGPPKFLILPPEKIIPAPEPDTFLNPPKP